MTNKPTCQPGWPSHAEGRTTKYRDSAGRSTSHPLCFKAGDTDQVIDPGSHLLFVMQEILERGFAQNLIQHELHSSPERANRTVHRMRAQPLEARMFLAKTGVVQPPA